MVKNPLQINVRLKTVWLKTWEPGDSLGFKLRLYQLVIT